MNSPGTVQVAVTDLEPGMYVSALDRPWIETPFLVQGFYIESETEIEELERYCRFVYIDVYRSRLKAGKRHSRLFGRTKSSNLVGMTEMPAVDLDSLKFRPRVENVGALLFPNQKLRKYEDSCSLEEEMPAAKKSCGELNRAVTQMMAAYMKRGELDVNGVKKAINPVVETMLRNPDASVWLARIKNEDSYAFRHSVCAAIWAIALGRQLGLPPQDLQRLAAGALMFDIGKLKLPPELLVKKERLSKDEFELMKSHVERGLEMLQGKGLMNRTVTDMIAAHHERHGGHGYPRGLHGDEIPVFGRIAAIVDCYDAITSPRPYAEALSPSNAIKQLYAWRDIDFQAELVEEFIQAIGLYPAGTLVELSNGEVGIVMSEYRSKRLRPKLLMVLDRDKNRLAEFRSLELYATPEDEDGKPLEIVASLEPGAYGVDTETIQI